MKKVTFIGVVAVLVGVVPNLARALDIGSSHLLSIEVKADATGEHAATPHLTVAYLDSDNSRKTLRFACESKAHCTQLRAFYLSALASKMDLQFRSEEISGEWISKLSVIDPVAESAEKARQERAEAIRAEKEAKERAAQEALNAAEKQNREYREHLVTLEIDRRSQAAEKSGDYNGFCWIVGDNANYSLYNNKDLVYGHWNFDQVVDVANRMVTNKSCIMLRSNQPCSIEKRGSDYLVKQGFHDAYAHWNLAQVEDIRDRLIKIHACILKPIVTAVPHTAAQTPGQAEASSGQ